MTACTAIAKKTGKPCTAQPMKGKPFCFRHDPEGGEQQQEASEAGGHSRASRRPPPHEMVDLPDLKDSATAIKILSSAVRWVFLGQLDPRAANAVATCIRAFSELRRDEQLEDKLRELEQAVNAAPPQLSNGHAAA